MSASVGHGCNSALQDVHVFCELLDQYQDQWNKALPAYSSTRLSDALAISELSDYASPRTKLMKMEWVARSYFKKLLPKWLSRRLRPMPMELLMDTTLSYTEVLQRTSWWTNRVKKTM
jgi:kynurenine 3-monooxygenase